MHLTNPDLLSHTIAPASESHHVLRYTHRLRYNPGDGGMSFSRWINECAPMTFSDSGAHWDMETVMKPSKIKCSTAM